MKGSRFIAMDESPSGLTSLSGYDDRFGHARSVDIQSADPVLDTLSGSPHASFAPTVKPYKFRPRFADEGLESLYGSDTDGGSDSQDIEDLDEFEKFSSEDLAECLRVAAEMEKSILERGDISLASILGRSVRE